MKFGSSLLILLISLQIHLIFSSNVESTYVYNLSTHVLNSHKGRPASGVSVSLYKLVNNDQWTFINNGKTADSGRFEGFASNSTDFTCGIYKLQFKTKEYYKSLNEETLYPEIVINFEVKNANEHYHIPILLNAYGYTTYRGS